MSIILRKKNTKQKSQRTQQFNPISNCSGLISSWGDPILSSELEDARMDCERLHEMIKRRTTGKITIQLNICYSPEEGKIDQEKMNPEKNPEKNPECECYRIEFQGFSEESSVDPFPLESYVYNFPLSFIGNNFVDEATPIN